MKRTKNFLKATVAVVLLLFMMGAIPGAIRGAKLAAQTDSSRRIYDTVQQEIAEDVSNSIVYAMPK